VFTGIIEALGKIGAIGNAAAGASVTIDAPGIASQLRVGDSIAVNGVCLTATHCTSESFTCDLSPETLARSSFGRARTGKSVNL